MRVRTSSEPLSNPVLLDRAMKLGTYLQTLSKQDIMRTMKLSDALAEKTHQILSNWKPQPDFHSSAVDIFLGDIYSGLQATTWSTSDRQYANNNLRILSGLYGILKPLDAISPYRLEMGYRLPHEPFKNLYKYWGDSIASTLPDSGPVINLSALEYSKVITPFIDPTRIITPRFLTINSSTNTPTFVVVHAKIARGAFAHWLIRNRITDIQNIYSFSELGYEYDATLSELSIPVFVCREFGGKGLSIRLNSTNT